MIDLAEAGRAFDAAFARRAPAGLRAASGSGGATRAFLRELFLATYPLRDVLPPPVLAQQADIGLAAFRLSFPRAMRRIVVGPDAPTGRIIIDWSDPAVSHGVDIAVHPTRGRGVGVAMLRAWVEVADARGLVCTLSVQAANRARALYARLGFRETPDQPPGEPSVAMSRAPRPLSAVRPMWIRPDPAKALTATQEC